MGAQRRWIWLGIAALFFACAAYFMSGSEEAATAETHVAFPVRQSNEEHARAERRRTIVPLLVQAAALDAGHRRLRPTDPMLAALPPKGPGASALVFEANAIRNSPVGQLLLDCLRAGKGHEDPLEAIRQKTGIDLNRDLDRMAVTSHGLLLSGNFSNAKWEEFFASAQSQTTYGNQGFLYTLAPPKDGMPAMTMGRWGNQMLIVGDTPQDIQDAIDRLEDRAPDAAPVLDESDSYGEVYGALDPDDVAGLLPASAANVATQLRSAAQQVKLHIDATGDVAMVADVSGSDGAQVGDLAKTLGGALALGRLGVTGSDEGSKLLGELLDQAKVIPSDGSFRAEVALPMSVLQKHLGWCRDGLDGGAAPPAPK